MREARLPGTGFPTETERLRLRFFEPSDLDAIAAYHVLPEAQRYLPIRVRDKSIKVDVKVAERADSSNPGHVAAPFAGVITVMASEGDEVEAGVTVATIEAMKMEAAITAPIAGTVQRLALGSIQQVEGGDLVLVVTP